MAKFSMEACLQMSYELVFQREEGHILSYHVKKNIKYFKENILLLFVISSKY